MSKFRKFQAETRLASIISEPGGMLLSDALRRGESVIANLSEACIDEIDVCIQKVEEIFADPNGDLEEIYRLATDIVTLCAVLPDQALAEVARSLCKLIDLSTETGRRHPDAVQVHIESMKLLRRSELDPASQQEIPANLNRMVEKLER